MWSYSGRVASKASGASGLQIRPVRLKGDLTSWEGDHARSEIIADFVRNVMGLKRNLKLKRFGPMRRCFIRF